MRIFLFIFSLLASPLTAQQPPSPQQQLVDKAATTFSGLISNENYRENIKSLLENAYGVILIPDYIKAGFVIGGEGGSGVILTRDNYGKWSSPSFITAAGGSFGLQVGVENSEILLVVMTEKGMLSLMNDSFTLGSDVSLAAGPIGGGLSAQTTANLSADIFAFSHSKGLFAGGALKGTVIKDRPEWNQAYYQNTGARPEVILKQATLQNPGADNLRQLLQNTKFITPPPSSTPPQYHSAPRRPEEAPHYTQEPQRDLSKEAAGQGAGAPQFYAQPSPPAEASYDQASQSPEDLLPWSRG